MEKLPHSKQRYDKVIPEHANAQAHFVLEVKTSLETLKRNVLSHLAHSVQPKNHRDTLQFGACHINISVYRISLSEDRTV